MNIAPGTTDVTIYLYAVSDLSGMPQPSLAHGDMTVRYVRAGAAAAAISLSALGSADADHSDGGWYEVDSTNCKGLYRLDLPDAVIATGATSVTITAQADDTLVDPVRISLHEVLDQNVTTHNTAGTVGAALNRIGSISMSVTSPVASDGTITIYKDVDYDGDGILTITVTGWSGYDLTDATGTFHILRSSRYGRETSEAEFETTATISETDGTVTITVALVNDDLDALETSPPKDEENYNYQVVATITVGEVDKLIPICDGMLTLKKLIEAASE